MGLIDTGAFCGAVCLAPHDLSTNKIISLSFHLYQFQLFLLVSMTRVSTPALTVEYLDTCALKRKALTYEFNYYMAVETLWQFTTSFCSRKLCAFLSMSDSMGELKWNYHVCSCHFIKSQSNSTLQQPKLQTLPPLLPILPRV